jgi:CheY-like chemotaxis protein
VAYKLLLADDSITIQKVVELILAEEDFEIKATGNGEEALALIPSFHPDVVLADVDMPKMNGYQLCEKIKANPATSGIPVILLTTAFEPVDEHLAKQINADDYIVKPFESQELVSKINAVLTVSAVAAEEAEVLETAMSGREEVLAEEDLWAMEEIPETEEIKAWPEEPGAVAGTEEFAEIAEEAEEAAEAVLFEEPVSPVVEKPSAAEAKLPVSEVSLPSTEALKAIFEKTVREKVSSFLSSLNMKDVVASITPAVKDSVEKILWEVTPDLVERMLKEMLKGSLDSLTQEVQKVIWETVPDLAETMISKEIERIKAEF